jgi:hypothetical protein
MKKMNHIEVIKSAWRRMKRPSRKTLIGLTVNQPKPHAWDYKPTPIRRWRPFPILLLALSLTISSNAFAALGETPRQFEARKPDAVEQMHGGTFMKWVGPKLTHTGWFGSDGKAQVETFWFNDHHWITGPELSTFMKPYDKAGIKHGEWSEFSDGMGRAMPLYVKDGRIGAILSYSYEDNSATIWLAKIFYAANQNSSTQSAAPSASAQATPVQDCAVVATELYARLKPSAYWARIFFFQYTRPDGFKSGHAVVVWKVDANTQVLVGDRGGTYAIDTSFTDLDLIKAEIESKNGFTITDAQWGSESTSQAAR